MTLPRGLYGDHQFLSQNYLEIMENNSYSVENLFDTIVNDYNEAWTKLGVFNILVIGKTGAGKSTLINSILRERVAETGKGDSVTKGVKKYKRVGLPVTVYDTEGLELTNIRDVQKNVNKLLNKNCNVELDQQIHIIWYCVNAGSNRFEDEEKNWIRSICKDHHNIPLILVLTQTTAYDVDFIDALKSSNLNIREVIPVLAEPMPQMGGVIIPEHGLTELVNCTLNLLPEFAKGAFVNATKSLDIKINKAREISEKYAKIAGTAALQPVPFADAPGLILIQMKMITEITLIFGLSFDRGFWITFLLGLAGGAGATVCGRAIVSSLLKLMGPAGLSVGGVISGATAYGLTLALGRACSEALVIYIQRGSGGQELSAQEFSNLVLDRFTKNISGRDNDNP